MLSPNATLDASEVFGFSFSSSQCASDRLKCAVVLCRGTDECEKKCFEKFHKQYKSCLARFPYTWLLVRFDLIGIFSLVRTNIINIIDRNALIIWTGMSIIAFNQWHMHNRRWNALVKAILQITNGCNCRSSLLSNVIHIRNPWLMIGEL